MAYALGDKYASIVSEWSQSLTTFVPTWSKFVNVRADNAFSIQNYADITPGALPTWDGAANIADVP